MIYCHLKVLPSTTLYDKNNIKIDVENPGGRNGQIHMHYKGNKYFYHVSQQKFVLENGDLASKSIQELLNNEAVVKAIAKGLVYLGY